MQATIIAAGSRGDVQPYVALGHGLKDAGHTVRVLASDDFRELITDHGLTFFDIGGSMESVTRSMEGVLEGGNFLKILSTMGPTAKRLVSQAAASGLAACEGSNLIIAGLGGLFVGLALSEKLGIPFVPAYLYPFTPTRGFPTVLSPSPQVQLPSWANRLSHRMGQQMMWQTFRAADNKARREVLRIAPLPFWGPFGSLEQDERTILCGYSQHVIPVPKDWGDSIHVTGYWFLDPPAGWEPPADLVTFLNSGPSPVYIGFGSMVNRKPEEVADLVLRALERSGQRGVVSAGWGGMKTLELPETVHMIGSIPHSWLFPRMAAVVHHGGVGTTAAGLRAGVPAVVTPFFGDQLFWGQRVHELGVGPRPIPRRRLSVDRLAEAIHSAVSSSGMRDRSTQLGERIRSEDGIDRAVKILEQVCSATRPTPTSS
ncbi:MAG: glycosyltransferase [Chloroflexi bacterium]|jgi:UDP:flavonoid glycosyltransferase YjiC (YdhE family)|nr:glycosyltransferase [Chloroflexota bacterium]